jgi:hypothetical protein
MHRLYDEIAEEGLLDALLLGLATIDQVGGIVSPEDFCSLRRGETFAAIFELHRRGKTATWRLRPGSGYVDTHELLLERGVHLERHDICDLYELARPGGRSAYELAEIVAGYAFRRRALIEFENARRHVAAGADPNAPQVAQVTINLLGARVAHALGTARTAGTVGWSDQARTRWAELYRAMADDDPGGLFGCIVARPEAQTLRLAVTYALMDSVGTIDVPHLEAAWAVWQYCRQSAAHIFGDAVGDEHADKLLRAIREAGAAGLDGTAQIDLFNRHLGRRPLEQLRVRLGRRIDTRTEETGGRPRLVSYDARLQYAPPG